MINYDFSMLSSNKSVPFDCSDSNILESTFRISKRNQKCLREVGISCKVRSIWCHMVCTSRIHHPVFRVMGCKVEGNRDGLGYFYYRCSRGNRRIVGDTRTGSLFLLFIILLLPTHFLLMSDFFAIVARFSES